MRITHEADYAVRIIHALAKDGGIVPARVLSERSGVTIQFCLKILRKLSQSGIVTANKGVTGGYRLKRPVAELSLGEVIESIDGPLAISHCLSDGFVCTRVGDPAECQFHCVFADISRRMRDELYGKKLEQFI